MLKVIKSLMSLVGIVGGLSFGINLLLGFGLVHLPIELPLHDIQQVTCADRKVYVALGYYSRIQIYDDKGGFLKAVPVGNYSKPYSFRLDENASPIILTKGIVRIEEPPHGNVQGTAFILEADCGAKEMVHIRQHLGYFIFGGPYKSALLAGFGVFVLLLFYPNFFTWMIDRDRRLRSRG